jgi:hypothetical protein
MFFEKFVGFGRLSFWKTQHVGADEYAVLVQWYSHGSNPITQRETCPSATLSTTNPTRIDLRSIPSLRDKRPGKNRLSHGMSWCRVSHDFRILWKAKLRRRVHKNQHYTPLWSRERKKKHTPSHAFSLKFILILSFHLRIIVHIVSFQVLRPKQSAYLLSIPRLSH